MVLQSGFKKLNIAVVGSGIAGLSAAWLLSQKHDVTLYEANPRLGGHSNTVDWNGTPVDTGFIVYNENTYPNLTAMFEHLKVETLASQMSFAVSMDDGRLEYSGGNMLGLVAQPSNIFKPRFWSMLKDIVRFFREAPKALGRTDLGSLDDYLSKERYGEAFKQDYLYPMAAAIWSTPAAEVGAYPAESFIRFNHNHGLLNLTQRPIWRTVKGGSKAYVARLLANFSGKVLLDRAATHIRREGAEVIVGDAQAEARFDHVVLACHADQALALLREPSAREQEVLGAFQYVPNEAVLHTDNAAMPKRRAAWSSWNYLSRKTDDVRKLAVSYWMNRLQHIAGTDVFVTLNPNVKIAADKISRVQMYEHPAFNSATLAAQKQLWDLQGQQNTWFCGAYFGAGFHEDGLQSGLAVAEALGGVRRPWNVKNESGRIFLTKEPLA